MDCIVIDDDKMTLTALRQLISQVDFLNLTKEYTCSTEAFNYLSNEPADLVLLDVEMPVMSGLELLRNLAKKPIIILMSMKKEHAADAFGLNVVDYLVKPITLPRFLNAVNRAKDFYENGSTKPSPKDELVRRDPDYLFFKINSVLTKVHVKEILYLQALGDYVNIYTTDKRYTLHNTLSSMEEKLSSEIFFRIHRSYLIAVNHIESIEENTLYIRKHPIPIGPSYKKALFEALHII